MSLMRSQVLTESSVLDFQSTTTVDSVQQNFDMYFGVGFGVTVGATVDLSFEPTTIAVRETWTDSEHSNEFIQETKFVEGDDGDELCINVFESPHSKTFVYEVCGGLTRCSHIPTISESLMSWIWCCSWTRQLYCLL